MSGGKTIATSEVSLGGLRVQNSGYGVSIPILYGTNRLSPNLFEYTDFVATPHTSSQSTGGKGGGITTSNTTYTYSAAVCMGLCEGPVTAFRQVWLGKDIYAAPANRNLTTFSGARPQTAWPWITTYHPGRALGYYGLAYVACANYDLGTSGSLGNHSFEVTGSGTLQNGFDVNAIDVISDLLSNVYYGAGFPSTSIGTLTQARNYCQANGIFISPVIAEQKPVQEWLTQIARLANAALVWSEGVMKVIPYGDQAVTGNGATYTPNTTPIYDLSDDDFIANGSDPVMVTRKKQADAYNNVQIEYLNRSNQYSIEPSEANDLANVEAYGLRPMSAVKMHEICLPAVAKQVAQTFLQRALYIRNSYSFTLAWKYCLLEPMDIVTLTDAGLGMNKTPVRITSIEENYDGLLTTEAEEMPYGVATPALYAQPAASGYQTNFNAAPPNTSAPIMFAPPIEMAGANLELWLAACGPAGWGGCNIWVSSDNATYKQVGSMSGSSRMGKLSAALGAGADPDLTGIARVDLTLSSGVLYSGTQADADLLHTPCYIDGEFLSYQTAILTAANKYDLSYLRRGAYHSIISVHAINAPFVRLDDAIFKLPYTAEQIGTTLFVKLPALNQYQGGTQSLADILPTSIVIPAPPAPGNVLNFACQQTGNLVVFSWNPVQDYALKGYDIGYAKQGETNWSNFILLTETARGTEMTNAAVPPGTWVFGIRAKDILGQLSVNIAMFNLIVLFTSPIVAQAQQDGGWAGVLASMVRHVTGVLVPLGTKTCDQYIGWEVFDQVVADPVSSCSYTTPVIDTGYDSALRIYSTSTAIMAYGQAGTINVNLSLDTWLNAGSDLGVYTSWVVGQVNMRYMKERLTLNSIVAGAVPILSAMTVWADTAPVIQNVASVLIAAGGSTITFPQAYHTPPLVICNALGTTALVANASNVTATGCTIHVFNSAGTDVGGTVTYTTTGA
jgi:hypothetical protein